MADPCTCPGVTGEGCPCDKCHGDGYHYTSTSDSALHEDKCGCLLCSDYVEVYCSCSAGKQLKAREN